MEGIIYVGFMFELLLALFLLLLAPLFIWIRRYVTKFSKRFSVCNKGGRLLFFLSLLFPLSFNFIPGLPVDNLFFVNLLSTELSQASDIAVQHT